MALNLKGKDGFYGWVNVAVMFFFNISMMMIMASFTVFLRFWAEGPLQWNRGVVTGANTLMTILTGVTAPMVGLFIMKRGARRSILMGNLFTIGGLLLVAYQHEYWQLYTGFGVLVGIGLSLGGMLAMMTIINDWFVMKRSIALSLSMASMGISGAVLNPSLMWMIHKVDWRNTCLIIAGTVLVFSVILPAIFLKNKPEDLGQVPDGPASAVSEQGKPETKVHKNIYKTPVDFTAGEAVRTRTMWLLVGYGTLTFLALYGLMPTQIDHLRDVGLTDNEAAAAVGVFSAVMAFSQLGIGFLGLRFKMHSLAVISITLVIAGFAVLVVSHSLLPVLIYCILLGMGFGIQSIAMGNLFPDYFGRSEFPKIMGYTMPFTIIIAGFGSPIAGFVRESTGSYLPAFRIFLGLMILAFFCIIFAKPPIHPSLKEKSRSGQIVPGA